MANILICAVTQCTAMLHQMLTLESMCLRRMSGEGGHLVHKGVILQFIAEDFRNLTLMMMKRKIFSGEETQYATLEPWVSEFDIDFIN